LKTGKELKRLKPDMILVRYWLPFMAPCFGTILRIVKKNKHTKVIAIVDNLIPHEANFLDKPFSRYFIKPVDACIAMSEKVFRDIKSFTQKTAIKTFHPLYDNFGEKESKTEARKFLGIDVHQNIILFFGFIRKYKGLDLLLEAMSQLPSPLGEGLGVRLLIAGEFYTDEKYYQKLIDELGIRENLILKTHFISNSEVRHYLCAADFVIQPYRTATQSGVTPLAYHFEKPMLVTNVGGLPAMVPNEKVGIVCEPNATSIAQGIQKLYALGEDYFIPNLIEEKKKYSWEEYTKTILDI
jgi:glycosyltransferase involved in cell wall biosynthesis